ncbi:AIF_HP2_G0052380.mRNA.1.CDS.1 [Saccharomyces cerevisiae]|nr:AIF_HP2_G0052380.mRNA.1.CDS.1 [Saccharomyces cerevisiae]CAI6798185.1 AIF_HP2_G0052380.mRNA.1.CDS.1 [Saccharomyces cerevisiae]
MKTSEAPRQTRFVFVARRRSKHQRFSILHHHRSMPMVDGKHVVLVKLLTVTTSLRRLSPQVLPSGATRLEIVVAKSGEL